MEKLDPSPLPQKSKIRKMRVFALRTASSLILGGLGLVVPFYSVQDCNLGQSKWKIQNRPPPHHPPKSKMGKWRVFALREALSLIGGRGDGCLLFHFILSKIVAPHTCVQDYLRQFAGKGEPINVQCRPFCLLCPFSSFVLPLHLNFLYWALIRLHSVL